MIFRKANSSDVEQIIQLQHDNSIDTLSCEQKQQGFLGIILSEKQLLQAIRKEQAVYVAESGQDIVAMAVCAPWHYWTFSPCITAIGQEIHRIDFLGNTLSQENSLFWGAVCVSHQYRGYGVFASLFEYTRIHPPSHRSYIYTYVQQDNRRALNAHVNKAMFVIKGNIQVDKQTFTELVCTTF